MLCRLRPARAFGDQDEHFATGNTHIQRSQPELRIALMAAGPNIEFVSVPGADDVGLRLREYEAAALAIGGNVLLDPRQDFALAYRATHVRAGVPIGGELPLDVKYADFDAIDLDHSAAGVRKGCNRSQIDFAHDDLAYTRRNHIDRSNRLRPAARIISETTVTTSVGVTRSAVTGGG
jgi:hypothetical protein